MYVRIGLIVLVICCVQLVSLVVRAIRALGLCRLAQGGGLIMLLLTVVSCLRRRNRCSRYGVKWAFGLWLGAGCPKLRPDGRLRMRTAMVALRVAVGVSAIKSTDALAIGFVWVRWGLMRASVG